MLIYDVVYDVNKSLAVLHHAATSHDNEIEAIPPETAGEMTMKLKPFHTEIAGEMEWVD